MTLPLSSSQLVYNQLLHSLMQQLRDAMPSSDSGVVALQLLGWKRLSDLQRIPEKLRFEAVLHTRHPSRLAEVLHVLSSALENEGAVAFEQGADLVHRLSDGQLLSLLHTIGAYSLTEAANAVELADTVASLIADKLTPQNVPYELAELMVGLAQLEESSSVYLPFDPTLQLTYRVQRVTGKTFSSLHYRVQWPALLNLLSDSRAGLYYGDEIVHPLQLSAHNEHQLTQFPIVLALPPVGKRTAIKDSIRWDPFHRFLEVTSSLSILSIRHVLASTRDRAVVGVPNGIFFSNGAEQALRESLIASEVIEGIIALPPALLAGRTTQLTLLVLNKRIPQREIVFVDGTNAAFHSRDGKARTILTGWSALLETYLSRQDSPFSRVVPLEEILRQEANLQVARYCLNPQLQAVQELLESHPRVGLKDLVQVVRPTLASEKAGDIALQEVGPGDFPPFGYAHVSGRTIQVSESSLHKNGRQLLQRHDVLITMKGQVGRVALMGEIPVHAWVTSLSCLVLRLPEAGPLDARVLFMFLNSGMGQALLKQLVAAGSTVPLIQLKELEKLQIPILPREEQQVIVAAFEQVVRLEQEIQHLRASQEQTAQQFWPLQSTAPEDMIV